MKKSLYFVVVAVAVFGGGCNSQPASSSAPTSTTVSSSPTKETMEIFANSPIPQAARIANDSGVEEAIAVAQWYTANATPAQLISEGDPPSLASPKGFEGRILLVLIVGEREMKMSKTLRDWFETSRAEGEFKDLGTKKLILIRARDRNVFDLGVLQIHEGFHARRCLVDRADVSTKGKAAYEEVQAYELENKVRLAIGGPKYRSLVDAEKLRQKQAGSTMGRNPDGTMKLWVLSAELHQAELEELFGPCGSPQDALKRANALWRQAIYELIETSFPKEDVKSAKATFYTSVERSLR